MSDTTAGAGLQAALSMAPAKLHKLSWHTLLDMLCSFLSQGTAASGPGVGAARIMAPAELAPGAATPEITAPSGRTYRSYAATALMQVLWIKLIISEDKKRGVTEDVIASPRCAAMAFSESASCWLSRRLQHAALDSNSSRNTEL